MDSRLELPKIARADDTCVVVDLALSHPSADVFVPDGVPLDRALARTTHLAIGAHADDLEFFAWHGISACLDRDDRWFTGIVVTDGGGSPRAGAYADWTDARMIEERRAEQREAARIGRYSAMIQLGLPSAVVKDARDTRAERDLEHILRWVRPQVAYLHNPADRHDSHVAVLLRSLRALRAMPVEARPPTVYGCEVWRDLDWAVRSDRIELPAGDRPELQAELAAVFRTQIAGGKRYDLAVPARRVAHATFGDSHSVDGVGGVTLAVDLAPLVHDPEADPLAFALAMVDRLATDVRARFARTG
ncbi:PIG-L deacetylase family protein [Congregicoccus parvus]|uniref:PIG-L deacetylase family protein n=1 Tax=Congregicoccus parvus TaxID=3081749 RepID=UPI003FA53EC6